MKRIKVIVLDADNCIFLNEETREGSEEIKDRAWFELFSEYDQKKLNEVIENAKHDIAGGRGDRNDIARRVLEHFGFTTSQVADEVIKRCELFDVIVQRQIVSIPIRKEVYEVLKKLSGHFALYLNTATPRDSILKTLDILNLNIFKGVYGRPGTKVENLRAIINSEAIQPEKMLFVGDMQSDCNAAQDVGCRFVGIHTKRNWPWGEAQSFPIISSLTELEEIVNKDNY